MDKDRLYKEFKKPNLKIRILLSSNALTHSTNIPNINYIVQYCMHKDKSVNVTDSLSTMLRLLGEESEEAS